MLKLNRYIILIFFCCLSIIGNAQKVLNGSFEKVDMNGGVPFSCTTNFAASNFYDVYFRGNYDIIISGITVIESLFEILNPQHAGLKDCSFIDTLFPYPQGQFCTRLVHGTSFPPKIFGPSDSIPMISFKISSTLIPSQKYLLIYYDHTPDYNSFTIYDSILVGTSITGYSIIDTINISTPVRGKWKRHSTLFSAKNTSNYITVRNYTGLVEKDGENTIDDFQLYHLDTLYKINAGVCPSDSVKLNATINGKRYEWSKNGVAYVPTIIDSIFYNYGTAPGKNIPEYSNLNGDSTNFIFVKDTGWYWNITYLSDSTISIDSFYVNANGVMHPGKTDISICKGSSIKIGQTTSITNAKYLWNSGDTTSQIIVNDTGWYWQKITLNTNCSKTDSFYIHWQLPPILNLPHDTGLCIGTSIILNASNVNYTKYLWDTNDTTSTITVHDSGIYFVTASNFYCSTTDTVRVSIINLPPINLVHDTAICNGNILTLDASNVKHTTYLWSTGETTPQIKVASAGKYTVTASNGICSIKDSTILNLYALPHLHLPPDTIVCLSQLGAVILDAGKFKSYSWYPTGEHTQKIAAVNPEIYLVVVTDSNNCVGRDSTLIDDNCPYQLYMPNAFTPNNDLVNETFKGYGYGIVQFEMYIYNRWGQEVFSTNDMNKGWDGTFKNNPCTADAYVWQVTYRLKNETFNRTEKGNVTLLK